MSKPLETTKRLKRIYYYFASKDDLRPAMCQVLYSSNFAVATNGHVLIIRKFHHRLLPKGDINIYQFVDDDSIHKDLKIDPDIIENLLKMREVKFPYEVYPNIRSILNDNPSKSKSILGEKERNTLNYKNTVSFNAGYLEDVFRYCRLEDLYIASCKFTNENKANFIVAEDPMLPRNRALILIMPVLHVPAADVRYFPNESGKVTGDKEMNDFIDSVCNFEPRPKPSK